MTAAEHDRMRMKRGLDEKQSSSFRTVKFVSAQGNQISVELTNIVKLLLPEPLNRVRVKNDSPLATKRPHLGDRLNRANFVVCRHDRDQNSVSTNRLLQIARRNAPFEIHRQPRNFKTLILFQV